jgi:hypothetical protein
MLLFELANKERTMSKNLVLMRDVICIYHPEFRASKDLRRYGMKHPDIFNVERLIEESLAAVGGYDFVDEAGRDFNDRGNSDSKTTTVIPDGNSKTAVINSVENKIGSLRVTIYNPFKESLDFMYIPRNKVQILKEPCYGKGGVNKEKLRIRWNQAKDYYNSFEDYRVKSFQELATA